MADREWTADELSHRFNAKVVAQLKREGRLAPSRYERTPAGNTIHWYSNDSAQLIEHEMIKRKAAGKKNLGQAFRGPWQVVERKGAKHCACGRVAARVDGKLAWCSKCYAEMTRYKDL